MGTIEQRDIKAARDVVANHNTWITNHPRASIVVILSLVLSLVALIAALSPEFRGAVLSQVDPPSISQSEPDPDEDLFALKKCRDSATEAARELFGDLTQDAMWLDCSEQKAFAFLTEQEPRGLQTGTCDIETSICMSSTLNLTQAALVMGCRPEAALCEGEEPNRLPLDVQDFNGDGTPEFGFIVSEEDASEDPDREYWGTVFASMSENGQDYSTLNTIVCRRQIFDGEGKLVAERCHSSVASEVDVRSITENLSSPGIREIPPGYPILQAWMLEQNWGDSKTASKPVHADISSLVKLDVGVEINNDNESSSLLFIYSLSKPYINLLAEVDRSRCMLDDDWPCDPALKYARVFYGWIGDRQFCREDDTCPQFHFRAGNMAVFMEGPTHFTSIDTETGEVQRQRSKDPIARFVRMEGNPPTLGIGRGSPAERITAYHLQVGAFDPVGFARGA